MARGIVGVVSLVVAAGGAPAALRAEPVRPPRGCVVVTEAPFEARGDGAADDTRAIQRAVDQSRCVFLPRGHYRTTAAIVMGAGRRLVGEGRDLTILHQVVAPPAGSVANSATVYDVLRIEGGNVHVSDLTLRGPMTGFPPLVAGARGQKGISIQPRDTASRITLVGIGVVGMEANGINIWNGVRDVYLCDVIVTDIGNEGVYVGFDVAGVTVRRLMVSRVRSWAFDTNGGQVGLFDFTIRDAGDSSLADDGGGVTWTADDRSTVRDDVRFIGGIIEDCIGSGVNITVPQSESAEATNLVVSDVRIGVAHSLSTVPGVFVSTGGGARQGRLRNAWLERLELTNVTLNVQNSTDLFLQDCRVENALPLRPSAGPATEGIRIDAGLRPDLGRITLIGCRVSGWRVGIRWQSIQAAYSAAANCLVDNTDAAEEFSYGMRARLMTQPPTDCESSPGG